jgi:hypothetical protein
MKPVAFKLKPVAFKLKPVAFKLKPGAFKLEPGAFKAMGQLDSTCYSPHRDHLDLHAKVGGAFDGVLSVAAQVDPFVRSKL